MGMTIALIFSSGTCNFQIQSLRVNFACTKRLFNLSAAAIINARNAHLRARCRISFSKIRQIPFSCRLVKGFTFLRRIQNQFKMSLEMCIVPVSIFSTEKNANLLVVLLQLRDHGCDNYVAWLFVHKVPFTLPQHVETTKTDKTFFCFAKTR